MIQIMPQMRIPVAIEPADFRRGIDGLAQVCRQRLEQDPFSGCVFVFHNRRGTALKVLVYDGQGFWLCHSDFQRSLPLVAEPGRRGRGADFATPLVVGIDNLLASQAYLNIVQFVDRRLFKMGIVISAIMVILAILFLIIAKQYVAIKDYSSLSYSKIERKKMSPWGRVGVVVFLIVVLIFAFIPYIGIGLDSFGRGWALTPIPVKYTLQYFERVAIETPKFIINSLLYSGISVFICIIVGVPVAWVMARTKVPGRDLLYSLTTLILALPGT